MFESQGREILKKMRDNELVGISVALNEWQKRIPKEVIGKFLKEVGVWVKHANTHGVEFMAVGLTGTHWNQIVWDQAVENKLLFVIKHRFCGLNLKLRDLDAPSNLCVKILSTTEHESAPCICDLPFKDHVNDWHSYGQDTDRITHREAMTMFYKKMIDKGILVFKSNVTRDNAELMFPTDERVEWKRKRKENKEKGIEVKKRTKVVEDHHDDCGDDLT
jgi:antitoxin component of RelBE/YafQ-DinJ toxin-antitoxin module